MNLGVFHEFRGILMTLGVFHCIYDHKEFGVLYIWASFNDFWGYFNEFAGILLK